jgi:cytochrome c-type biogenesis protein CcmE
MAGKAPQNKLFRIGGMVVEGSVSRPGDGLTVQFGLTDNEQSVTVRFAGILPDLFREGQGIIANGKLDASGDFVAEEVLAKHDENYMPPELAGMNAKQESE